MPVTKLDEQTPIIDVLELLADKHLTTQDGIYHIFSCAFVKKSSGIFVIEDASEIPNYIRMITIDKFRGIE